MPGLSRFSEVVLHQGRMEQFFLDAIRASYPPPAKSGEHDAEMGGRGSSNNSEDDPTHGIEVERMVIPTALSIDEAATEDDDAHPVTVMLRHLTEEEATPTQMLSNLSDGIFRSNLAEDDVQDILSKSEKRNREEEVIKAKYVVGCDGAHSWTRKTLGKEYEMVGKMTDFIWFGDS